MAGTDQYSLAKLVRPLLQGKHALQHFCNARAVHQIRQYRHAVFRSNIAHGVDNTPEINIQTLDKIKGHSRQLGGKLLRTLIEGILAEFLDDFPKFITELPV